MRLFCVIMPTRDDDGTHRSTPSSDLQGLWEIKLCAWIIVQEGAALEEDGVLSFRKDEIAHRKIPRYIRFVDAFPTAVTGKVQKFVMRDMMMAEFGQRAAADGKGAGGSTMEKIYTSPEAALDGLLFDGMTIMSGGFGLSGNPESLIPVIRDANPRDLTIISNNCGADGFGLWMLLNNGQIRKMISSYVGENKLFEDLYLSGKLELELNPQGTLAERIRAGGAGIPAFFTKTGVGTVVAENKVTQTFFGETYVQELWLKADLSIVKAWKADPEGNLVYRKTARNFNPVMATAGAVTVAEVEEIVPAGALDADCIHTPGIYVDRIVKTTINEKRIEKLTTRERSAAR